MPEAVSACGVAVAWLGSLMILHVGFLAWTRTLRPPSAWGASAAWVAVLILTGSWSVWASLEPVPTSLRVGATCLFLAGCLVYLELRSLLSRGYSLRILLDLMDKDHGETLERLRAEYSNGLGMRGLLSRRLATLARCRLTRFDGRWAGPLTGLGLLCAVVTASLRTLLRLEVVG